MGQRMPCKCIIYLPNYIITCLLTSLFLSCETSDFCILQHFIINQLQLKPFSFFFCTQNYFNMAEFQDELKSQGVGSRGGWCAWGPFNSQGSLFSAVAGAADTSHFGQQDPPPHVPGNDTPPSLQPVADWCVDTKAPTSLPQCRTTLWCHLYSRAPGRTRWRP